MRDVISFLGKLLNGIALRLISDKREQAAQLGSSAVRTLSKRKTIVGPLHRCSTVDTKPLPRRSWQPRYLENARVV
jgi:hypothetical protein